MNPHEIFCPNIAWPARGQTGKGNIGIHSQKDQRYICGVCNETFTTTKGTIFYRLRTAPETVIVVMVLLANGCPIQAIVKAFGFDERTVRDWWQRAGKHCQAVHEHQVGQAQLDLQQDTSGRNRGQAAGRTFLDGVSDHGIHPLMVRRCSECSS